MQNMLSITDAAKIIYKSVRGHWEDSFGDCLPLWEKSPQKCREMLMRTVTRLSSLDNGHITPEISHRLWWLDAIRDGWVYGENLDLNDPLHPTNPKMKPWDLLTHDQRVMTDIVICEFRMLRSRLDIVPSVPRETVFQQVHSGVFNNYNG